MISERMNYTEQV